MSQGMQRDQRQKKMYHFISHTHWDREWYQTFEQFRYRLVDLIDKLLDLLDANPAFKAFHLDGQTIVLEDYAEMRPANKDRLERHIRDGRILIGPWYQQNDLFLTSGESTVRSLLQGIADSRRLGGEMKVGYLPDHFGLIGQMPQILRGVGLDNCVQGRGYDWRKHQSPFYEWRAPDGSAVTGLNLYHWYNNAQRLPIEAEPLQAVFEFLRAREEAVHSVPHYAMMNGVDHMEAQDDLPEVLEKLRAWYGDELEIVHDTLPEYVRSVQSYVNSQPEGTFPVVEGELREGEAYSILAGTLSSRIYIKQANLVCHDLIEKYMEPLSAWCAMKDLDRYEAGTLQYAWKLYMHNHPHDSICGCSQDAVHDQMMDRYGRLRELAGQVIDRKLAVLARQVSTEGMQQDDQMLVVVNTAQLETVEAVRATLYFMRSDDVRDFSIEDGQGNSLAYRVVSERPSRIHIVSPVNLVGEIDVQRYDIEWKPTVPAMGYAAYRVRPHQPGRRVKELSLSDVDAGVNADAEAVNPILENSLLRIEMQADGTFHIHDKTTGVIRTGQGQIEDVGDRGDLYVFSEVSGQEHQVWNGPVAFVSRTKNDLYDECAYQFTWLLPACLDETRQQRSAQLAPCSFRVTIRLEQGAPHVNMTIQMDNQVKDHRLRVLFPGSGKAQYVWAGGQFDVVKRQWDDGKAWKRDANSQPFWKWFAPVTEDGSVAIFAKGLHEYEMTDGGMTAGVTVLRSVETIMLRDRHYLEHDYQPKGQCLGTHTVELAVRPFADISATRLYQEAERFHQGVATKRFPLDEEKWSVGRAWVQDSVHQSFFKLPDPNRSKPRLPRSGTFLSLAGDAMISAWKWSEDGHSAVLRLYNVEERTSHIKLEGSVLPGQAIAVNLLEEPTDEVHTARVGAIEIRLDAKKIATYRLI